jgi:hypothetical protein
MLAYEPVPMTVLIGDLRGSRELDPKVRTAAQERIQAILADLEEDLPVGALATRLVLTAGDEIQAVFREASGVVTAIQELTDRLHGSGAQALGLRPPGKRQDWSAVVRHRIRFGVGRGELSTGELPTGASLHGNPALLDGPAFHRARAAIGRGKKGKRWVTFEGFSDELQEDVETLFDLMGSIRSDWAQAQWLYTYQRRKVKYQKEVAERFGLSASVVSESLKAAHYRAIRRGEEAVRRMLTREDQQ